MPLSSKRCRPWRASSSNAALGAWWWPAGKRRVICVQALDIRQMQIGPQIDPGVPWCYANLPHVRAADSTLP